MKKLLLIALSLCFMMPLYAQKLTKEEKAAQQKALYEAAVKAVEEKDFVIIPDSYIDSDGIENPIQDNSVFFAYEKANLFMQGAVVCDNSYTNIAEAKEFTPKYDKKGNLKLRILVEGRQIHGVYQISMRAGGNTADVIFTPRTGGTVRKFQGPLVKASSTRYMKRSNPM